VSAVVAEGEVVMVVADNADTQVIVATCWSEAVAPPVKVTVDVAVVEVGAASVTVYETVPSASVTNDVETADKLRPGN